MSSHVRVRMKTQNHRHVGVQGDSACSVWKKILFEIGQNTIALEFENSCIYAELVSYNDRSLPPSRLPDVTHVTLSPSIFAYCKRSKTGGGNSLETCRVCICWPTVQAVYQDGGSIEHLVYEIMISWCGKHPVEYRYIINTAWWFWPEATSGIEYFDVQPIFNFFINLTMFTECRCVLFVTWVQSRTLFS